MQPLLLTDFLLLPSSRGTLYPSVQVRVMFPLLRVLRHLQAALEKLKWWETGKNLLAKESRLEGQLYYCCHSHAQWRADLGRREIKPCLSYSSSLHIIHWCQWTVWNPNPSLGWVWGAHSEVVVSTTVSCLPIVPSPLIAVILSFWCRTTTPPHGTWAQSLLGGFPRTSD